MLLTVSTLPKTRRYLSADGLLTLIKERFQKIPDPRQNPVISVCDALLSGLALFALKDPSLLAFDERRHERNLRALFGIEQVPSDTQLREILDGVDPEDIRAAFNDIFRALQRGIPNVLDRLIQQAIQQVLTPLFDPKFSESSHCFRPKRSAHGAAKQVQLTIRKGHRFVVDMDRHGRIVPAARIVDVRVKPHRTARGKQAGAAGRNSSIASSTTS